jgi:hypothetical protein
MSELHAPKVVGLYAGDFGKSRFEDSMAPVHFRRSGWREGLELERRSKYSEINE